MDILTAALGVLLSLCGVDTGGTTLVQRSRVDGRDVLVSRATLHGRTARLECVRSASGRCDYTVLAPRCAPPVRGARACPPAPVARFSVPANGSRRLADAHGLHLCVSAGNRTRPDCEALGTPGPDSVR